MLETAERKATRRRALAWALGGGAALSALTPGRAGALAGDQGLVGGWRATVTAADPPLGSFAALFSFLPDGGVLETRRLYVAESPLGPLLETPGHGAWERTGNRSYSVAFVFLLQGAPDNEAFRGVPLGTDEIAWRPELDGDRLAGPFRSRVVDPGGTVVFSVAGSIEAARIGVG